MSVIVEVEVPPHGFVFGRLLNLEPGIKVHVEQIAPTGDAVMPFSWVSGDIESFEENLEDRMEYEVILTDGINDRRLYRFDWNDDDELVRTVVNSDGAVLEASGTHQVWKFKIRFDKRKDVSRFHEHCNEQGIPVTLQRIYNPIEVSGTVQGMTTTQARTLVDALEEGYFDIPRKTSLVELADMYGISDQAVSERLRRAMAELVESSLTTEDEQMMVSVSD